MSSDHLLQVSRGLADLSPAPPLWLLSICRSSCGFCQKLNPTWQLLAVRLAPMVGVASWDADRLPELPEEFGDVRSTPAIFALRPPGTPGANTSSWSAIHYLGSRTLDNLVAFATQHMPNGVTPLHSEEEWAGLERFASERRQPRVVVFLNQTTASQTPAVLRSLASSFSRHLAMGEVRLRHARNDAPGAAWARRLGVADTLPAMVALPPGNAPSVHCTRWTHAGLRRCLVELLDP